MSPDQERRLEEIFSAARDVPPLERTAFLERACGGDAELRRQADSLLAAHEQAGEFLQPIAFLSTPNSSAEKPGDRIGRYKLLEQIGEGGFGVVWMAEQEEPVRRRVALKIIKLGMDTKEVVARFEAERQALAMMAHPNIASIFDGGATDTGRPYFVMELVPGMPITDYCDANQLSARERLELFIQVCQAVQHAHQKGIIHRDLKPSNILVTVKDDRPVAKVIDFGVAKATQARLTGKTLFTQLRQRIGTPAYMSPEQAGLGSLDVDTRTDIYSLGVLLYELLTGGTPFDTEQLLAIGYDAILRTIREEEPPKPSTRLSTLAEEELKRIAANRRVESARLNRLVQGDLDWIVMKSLEKDRTRRYQTISDFAQDIERHLRSEPVSAAGPGIVYRTGKFLRRHRVRLAVAALVVLVFNLAGIGVKLGLKNQSSRQALQAMGSNAVFTTARAGNTEALRRLLDANPRLVDARDSEASTPLFYAGLAGQTEAVRLLLRRGAAVNATNPVGYSALLHAASRDHGDTVIALLNAGANPNQVAQDGITALLVSSLNGSTKVGTALLTRGARTDLVYQANKISPLHQAAMLGHADFVALLLQHGAKVDQVDTNGYTALHSAATSFSGTSMAAAWGIKVSKATAGADLTSKDASAGAVFSNQVARTLLDFPESFLKGGRQHTQAAELLLSRGAQLEATDHNHCTPLLIASLCTNWEVASVLLKHRANVNARASDGSTPLNLAALKGSLPLAEVLLKAGADLNIRDEAGFTPLNTAIEQGRKEIVPLLLSHQANPDLGCPTDCETGFNGQAPMHTAATRGDIESMRLLLEHGAALHPLTPLGTPLAWAVSTRQLEAVKFLLKQGAKPDVAPPQSGSTSLHHAAMLGQPEVVQALLEAGATVNADSSWQGTPLNVAAAGPESARRWAESAYYRSTPRLLNARRNLPCIGSEEDYIAVLRILLAAKANLNARETRFDRTPLFTAVSQSHVAALSILLDAGADIHAVDWLGLTVLHAASESNGSVPGLSNMVSRLLQAGASVETRDKVRATPLHAAANTGKPVMARLLLDAGARVNAVGPELRTPLQFAVLRGQREVAELLLAKGADPDWRDSYGSTALQQAVQLRSKEMATLLLEHGANVHAGNPEGSTALMASANAGDLDMIKLLLKHGAKVDTANQNGWTAFLAAVGGGHIQAAQFLLEQGAKFDSTDDVQATPLIVAAKAGQLVMVKFLLERKAPIEDKDKHGFTALAEAADRGYAEVAEFLLNHGAEVNSLSEIPSTPLHNAANAVFTNETCYCAVAKVLLAHGANVNARMRRKQTALHRAADWGRPQIIKILLEAKADANARDEDGKTALDLAIANRRKECIELLRNASIQPKPKTGP